MQDEGFRRELGLRIKAMETLIENDRETVIKVIDAMITKRRVTTALAPVDP
jgi:uncharacterized protein YqgV (UPF0045/DUF77 family)